MQLLQTSNQPFAPSPKDSLSERYAFVDSDELIELVRRSANLIHLGTSWASLHSNVPARRGRQKHIMAFGYDEGEGIRLLITNDHEGRTALRFNLGYYRAVCANGIIAGDSFFTKKIVHKGNPEHIAKVIREALKKSFELKDLIKKMKGHQTNVKERLALKKCMAALREHDLVDGQLLQPRRPEDHSQDLWTYLNLVQEYAIRGGYSYHVHDENGDRAFKKTGEHNIRLAPAVKSIGTQSRINKGLFEKAMGLYNG